MTTARLEELPRYNIGTYVYIIYSNALLHSDQEAFIYGNVRTTFSALSSHVNKIVHALRPLRLSNLLTLCPKTRKAQF